MILTQDGHEIEWGIRLDRGTSYELARWRDFVEANCPYGHSGRFQWDDAGELQIVIRREKLLGPR
jgi:hypothetical protein